MIRCRAPSNIALIKYMGKKDSDSRIAANASMSMTLNDFFTEVSFSFEASTRREFQSLKQDLSTSGTTRVEKHLERIWDESKSFFRKHGLDRFEVGKLIWNGTNNFPSSAGIASSASSFAALTTGFLGAIAKDSKKFKALIEEEEFLEGLSQFCRLGSGSACRSVFGPWAFWEGESATKVDSRTYPELVDFVVLVSKTEKKVSSSAAHEAVLLSPLWPGRVDRAQSRLVHLMAALKSGDLRTAANISWSEFWEMHSLFHTSNPSFTYLKPDTLKILEKLSSDSDLDDPPIVTLDAGPNVHILVRKEQRSRWEAKLKEDFSEFEILISEAGRGLTLEVC